jgi:hypothetical protein
MHRNVSPMWCCHFERQFYLIELARAWIERLWLLCRRVIRIGRKPSSTTEHPHPLLAAVPEIPHITRVSHLECLCLRGRAGKPPTSRVQFLGFSCQIPSAESISKTTRATPNFEQTPEDKEDATRTNPPRSCSFRFWLAHNPASPYAVPNPAISPRKTPLYRIICLSFTPRPPWGFWRGAFVASPPRSAMSVQMRDCSHKILAGLQPPWSRLTHGVVSGD